MPSTYDSIATTTLGTAQATVSFSSIPSTYTDLILIASVQQTSVTTITNSFTRINSDTGGNYSVTSIWGNGAGGFSGRRTNADSITHLIDIPTASPTTFIYQFMNYANTTTNKSVLSRIGNPTGIVIAQAALYRSTSAINAISMTAGDTGQGGNTDNFAIGSTFTLYGIRAA
jgi:uncharacterized lipoprotein YddW (UPF0748 family)